MKMKQFLILYTAECDVYSGTVRAAVVIADSEENAIAQVNDSDTEINSCDEIKDGTAQSSGEVIFG